LNQKIISNKTYSEAEDFCKQIMKDFNKHLKKNDNEGMLSLGFTQEQIYKLSKPDFCGRAGFPDYKLTNTGAEIRRLKLRLAETIKRESEQTTEKTINNIRIVDNVEDNRLQMFFPCKPSESVRKSLKSYGFRWNHTDMCWQLFRSNAANWKAETIANNFNETKL
jgi:hypothetical protein